MVHHFLAVLRYLVGYGGPAGRISARIIPSLVLLDKILPAPTRDRVLFVVYCADVVVAGTAVDLVFASSLKEAKLPRVGTAVAVEEVGTSSALKDVISRPTLQGIRTKAAV